jgi:hypothetical protein
MSESVAASTITTNTTATHGGRTVSTTGRGNGPRTNTGGGGRGNGSVESGRSKNNKNKNQNNKEKKPTVFSKSNFKGNTTELHGHVFELFEESGNRTQFTTTLEVIGQYSSKHCTKYSENLRSLFREPVTAPFIKPPTAPGPDANKLDQALFDTDVRTYSKRRDALSTNLHMMYAVIWGQCSKNMQTRLKAIDGYDTATDDDDCAWLLNQIKGLIHQFNTEQYIYISLADARDAYINCKQSPEQTDAEYYKSFKAVVDVLEYYGANIAEQDLVVNYDRNYGNSES